jgi:NAD+ synthase (glutamine-hydrolysing)
MLAETIGRSDISYSMCLKTSDLIGVTGSYHVDLNMDTLVTAVRNLFGFVTGRKPQFRAHGGTEAENLALQNIQVRASSRGSS